jgi:hypothetical protein
LIQKALDEAAHRGQAKLREEIKQEEEMCDRLALANKKFYDENAKLRGVVERLREVVEEASLPPYHDSDAVSLLQTLAVRAKRVLAESAEVLGEE